MILSNRACIAQPRLEDMNEIFSFQAPLQITWINRDIDGILKSRLVKKEI